MSAMLANRARYLNRTKHANPASSQHYTPDSPPIPDLMIPGLYLTDMFTARAVLLPSYLGKGRPAIKYVLSVLDSSISQPKPKPVNANQFVQKLIVLDDTMDADLLGKLGEACDWIDEMIGKDDGGVMVHCQLGQSRSASVVIAYLMRKQGLEFQKAYDKVKYRRGIVKPNPGFQTQLQLWETMKCNIYEADPDKEGELRLKNEYVKWKEEQKRRVQRILSY